MVKVIVLLPRRGGLAAADFALSVREQHLPLVTALPGLRRLVVDHVLPGPDEAPPAYEAVAEDWFDDPPALGAAFASRAGQAEITDAPIFLDMARFQLLVVGEQDDPLPV